MLERLEAPHKPEVLVLAVVVEAVVEATLTLELHNQVSAVAVEAVEPSVAMVGQ